MLHKTQGIVLKQIKYGEKSVIVTMYTKLFGRQTYMVKGIRSKTGKIKPAFLQALTLLDLEAYHHPKRELQNLKEAAISVPFYGITSDIYKNTIAQFLAEVLYKVLREEEENVPLFDFVFESIQKLDEAQTSISDFHIHFLVHLTKHLGFFFNTNYTENSFFDLKEGCFSANLPPHSYYLDKDYTHHLHYFIEQETYGIERNPHVLNGFMRNTLVEKLLDYYQLHLEGIGTIKSFAVLQELFRN